MILAGKCQDTYGPRVTTAIGGLMVGVGFIWISQTTSYVSWILGFGFIVGVGIAFGYSPITPATMKWFPPNQVGKITGCVVAGFGLASVYIAPLTMYLLKAYGFQKTMLTLGIAFLIVVCGLAMFMVNPPEGYRPAGYLDRRNRSKENFNNRALFKNIDMPPKQVVKTSNFWMLWVLYFIGVGGLVMSKVSQMLIATSGSFNVPLMFAGIMLVVGACRVAMVKDQKDQLRQKIKDKKLLFRQPSMSN